MLDSSDLDIQLLGDDNNNEAMSCGNGSSRAIHTSQLGKVHTVFVCGFVSKRLHNQALCAIIRDLMPHYFVACNQAAESSSNGSAWEHSREFIRKTDAFVFLMNEFTLRDPTCLHALQEAWRSAVPMIMLRKPRMRLYVDPLDNDKPSSTNRSSNGCILDTGMLQDIIYAGYRSAIDYDAAKHQLSMRRLLRQLRTAFSEVSNREEPRHTSMGSPDVTTGRIPDSLHHLHHPRANNDHLLHLPQIAIGLATPLPPISLSRSSKGSDELTSMSRSNSTAHTTTQIKPMIMRSRSHSLNKYKTSRQKTSLRRVPSPVTTGMLPNLPDAKIKVSNQPKIHVQDTYKQIVKNDSPEDTSEPVHQQIMRPRVFSDTSEILNDPEIYHPTQYLVFHVFDRNKQPQRVVFPKDLSKLNDAELISLWDSNSDTDLDDEAEQAKDITGSIDLPGSPDSLLPHEKPLF